MTATTMAPGFRVLINFWEHQFIRFRKTFRSTITAGLVGPLMYLLGIGIGLGSQVDAGAADLGTDSYVDFVGPGLMAASAMQLAASESLWQTAGLLRWRGVYVSVAHSPLAIGQLFVGHVFWIGFRVVVSTTMYLLILALFGIVGSPLALLSPLVAALTGMAFAAPISAYTGWAISRGPGDQSFPMILRLGIIPLFLFSGAFYPIDQLPAALEWLARVLPVWHGVELVRGMVLGQDLDLGSAAGHLAVLVGYIAAGLAIGRHTFTKVLGT